MSEKFVTKISQSMVVQCYIAQCLCAGMCSRGALVCGCGFMDYNSGKCLQHMQVGSTYINTVVSATHAGGGTGADSGTCIIAIGD